MRKTLKLILSDKLQGWICSKYNNYVRKNEFSVLPLISTNELLNELQEKRIIKIKL